MVIPRLSQRSNKPTRMRHSAAGQEKLRKPLSVARQWLPPVAETAGDPGGFLGLKSRGNSLPCPFVVVIASLRTHPGVVLVWPSRFYLHVETSSSFRPTSHAAAGEQTGPPEDPVDPPHRGPPPKNRPALTADGGRNSRSTPPRHLIPFSPVYCRFSVRAVRRGGGAYSSQASASGSARPGQGRPAISDHGSVGVEGRRLRATSSQAVLPEAEVLFSARPIGHDPGRRRLARRDARPHTGPAARRIGRPAFFISLACPSAAPTPTLYRQRRVPLRRSGIRGDCRSRTCHASPAYASARDVPGRPAVPPHPGARRLMGAYDLRRTARRRRTTAAPASATTPNRSRTAPRCWC